MIDQLQLNVRGISHFFGKLGVLNNISIEARKGETLAIIDPNGAGKTCLLNFISGIYQPQMIVSAF